MAWHNTIVDNRFHYRCWHCGDSKKNPIKAHLVINLESGSYHCFRCGYSGHMPLGDLMTLVIENQPEKTHHEIKTILSKSHDPREIGRLVVVPTGQLGPLNRFSGVERRYQYSHEQGPVEIFEIRTLDGRLSGFHARLGWTKAFVNSGPRLFGRGLDLDRDRAVRLVEGPYDVRYPNDVCVFGMPTHVQAKALLWRPVILCPDGDVWDDYSKLRGWLYPFIKNSSWVSYVEWLDKGADPDEVPEEQRTQVTFEKAKKRMYQLENHRRGR